MLHTPAYSCNLFISAEKKNWNGIKYWLKITVFTYKKELIDVIDRDRVHLLGGKRTGLGFISDAGKPRERWREIKK